VLIDVRIDEDFDADPRLIPTAFRHSHKDMHSLAASLQGSKVVVLCQKGMKLSQGGAAMLRAYGVAAETLEGGHLAWRDAGEPLVPAAKMPDPSTGTRTLWVTRHRPKIDRIACPWLIRRFIDPSARFLFVAPSEVLEVAERFDATPFDVEGVFWSHRGDCCTFDVMIEEFALDTEPLKRLATIVRGADTNRHDLAPQAAGLLAASVGLSRMYRDDIEQLTAGMLLYDAFYRWSRDASDEGHDWPAAMNRS
jgi:rhodanese-related sulfurtransferase